MSSWEVSLSQFEGPMDLLVYVVQRNELKPFEISISEITDQYLTYLEEIERADLTEAGDFLEMASRLMALKARELLPREQQTEEDLFEFDEQRLDLIRGIFEYRAFRQMAQGLQEREEESRNCFGRGRRESFGKGDEGIQGRESGIFQLYEAFSVSMRASRSLYGDAVHTVEIDFFTIQDAQQQVGNLLRRRGRAAFDELVGPDRQPLVTATTFQALLEMVKTEQVVVRQIDPTGVLWTYRKRDNPEYFDEVSAPLPELPDRDSERLDGSLVELVRDRSGIRGDKLGLDDLVRELSKRVQEGKRIRDRDLDHLLSGGSLVDLDAAEDSNEDGEEVESAGAEEAETSVERGFAVEVVEEVEADDEEESGSRSAVSSDDDAADADGEESGSGLDSEAMNFDSFFK